jgi:hypothetical protein
MAAHAPHVTAQIARDGIPPTPQEVGRSDEEGKREVREGDVPSAAVQTSAPGSPQSLGRARGLAAAVPLRNLVSPALLLRRLPAAAVSHRSGLAAGEIPAALTIQTRSVRRPNSRSTALR